MGLTAEDVRLLGVTLAAFGVADKRSESQKQIVTTQ